MRQVIVFAIALLFSVWLPAQTKVKIITEKDGKREVIEKELSEGEDFDLDEFLKKEGVDIEILGDREGEQEVEIIIKDDHDGNMFFSHGECKPKAFLGVVHRRSLEDGGVEIARVVEGSTAEEMGLQPGDIILEMDGETISDFGDLAEAIEGKAIQDEVTLRIERDGKKEKLKGQLGERPGERFHMTFPGEENIFEFHGDGPDMDAWMDDLHEQLESLHDMDFEFEFDEENAEEWQRKLESQMEEWSNAFEEELEGIIERRMVIVVIEDIEKEEADEVNEQADPALRLTDDLDLGELRFFPNPGDGRFDISFNAPSTGDLELMIYDAQGRKVYYEMLSDFDGDYQNSIDISDRDSGNYFLQIMQNGKTYSRKIIKQ